MAQSQTWTDEGIGELVKLATGGLASAFKSICGLTDLTSSSNAA